MRLTFAHFYRLGAAHQLLPFNVWNRCEGVGRDGKITETKLYEVQLRYHRLNKFLRMLGQCGFEQVVPDADFQGDEPAAGTAVITSRAMT